MKKLLLSIFTVMLGIATTYATETDVVFSTMGYENAEEVTTTTVGDITITFNANGNSNSPKYYNSGTAIRMYPNNIMTITSASEDISSIVLTFSGPTYTYNGGLKANPTLSSGSYTEDGVTGTWTGSAKTIEITCPDASSGSIRLQSVKVNTGAAAAVSTPTFDPAGGTYYAAQTVAIACATEGAKIYYTIDGTEPTSASTEYTAPLDIVSTTTVKALAVLGDDVSAVATETYTISTITQVSSVAAFVALTDGDVVQITIPLIAIYQNGQYLYVTDGTDYTLIYGSTGQTYTNGMIIPAGIEGKKTTYRGLIEFASPVQSTFQAGQDGTAVSPTVATLDQITADSQNTYVQFNGVSFTPNIDNTKQGFLSSGDASLATYNQFNIDYPTDLEKTYDVVGFVSVYNSTVQLNVVSFTEASGTGLRDLVNADVIITTDYSAIHVNTADNAQITVFNAVGQPIVKTAANAGSTLLQVAPGFYIVKVDNKTTKVLVK